MAQTFILNEATSDLTGGGVNFNASLATSGIIPGNLTIGGNPSGYGSAFTGSGVPGTDGTTGNYTVEVNVTAANVDVTEITVQLHRVNSSGTVQTSSSISSPQSGATTGIKTFTFTSLNLGTWASGDRLRVDYRANATTGHGTRTVNIQTQTTSAEVITPFSAALSANVNQVTETDSVPGAASSAKTKAIGQASDTDTAQSITVSQPITVNVGQAVETSSAGLAYRDVPWCAGASGRYLIDQNSDPWLLKGDTPWNILCWAGNWTHTWQEDLTHYAQTRGSQGFNAIHVGCLSQGTYGPGGTSNYNTWDGVSPWAGGVEGDLNDTYWQRMDHLVDECARQGITVFLNLAYADDWSGGSGAALGSATNTEHQNYGTAVATRYAAYPNVCYSIGGDYFGSNDTEAGFILTGVTNVDASAVIFVQNYAETTSRRDCFDDSVQGLGNTWATFNYVYSYDATYRRIEYSWQEASPLPTVWGDGHYDGGSSERTLMRNLFGWSITSGGVGGHMMGIEAIWQWQSGAYAALTTSSGNGQDLPQMRSIIEGIDGYQDLVPDINSAFITAGRGTKSTYVTSSGGSGGEYNNADTPSTYVTGAKNAAGTLALIYMPDSTQTITVDMDQMGASGRTATWIDPTDGSTTAETVATTYSTSATNSAGGSDWFLLLEATSGVPVGQVSETDTAQATGKAKQRTKGQAATTETGQTVGRVKAKTLGLGW